MAFDPYLHFQGNCAEAMQWYAGLFGGDLFIMRLTRHPTCRRKWQALTR